MTVRMLLCCRFQQIINYHQRRTAIIWHCSYMILHAVFGPRITDLNLGYYDRSRSNLSRDTDKGRISKPITSHNLLAHCIIAASKFERSKVVRDRWTLIVSLPAIHCASDSFFDIDPVAASIDQGLLRIRLLFDVCIWRLLLYEPKITPIHRSFCIVSWRQT